jgi:hypothetical protein
VSETTRQSEREAPGVPEGATQGAEIHGRDWTWVEATVWSERMLAALENGVKGGKWVHQLTDGFVRRRLRAILRKQEKRPGTGKCRDDHLRWPNTFFAAQGLFTLSTARVLASQSR